MTYKRCGFGFRIPCSFMENQKLFWAFIEKFLHYHKEWLGDLIEHNYEEIDYHFSDGEFEKSIDFMVNHNADFSIFVERRMGREETERLFTAVQKSTEKKEAKRQAEEKKAEQRRKNKGRINFVNDLVGRVKEI